MKPMCYFMLLKPFLIVILFASAATSQRPSFLPPLPPIPKPPSVPKFPPIPKLPPFPRPPPFQFPPGFPGSGPPIDPRKPMTCSNYPQMCNGPWSVGPDCCQNTCIDTKSDFNNCGGCGRACRFGEMCCGGRCVDVMVSTDHCGWCSNACTKGTPCRFGMCSYA